MMFKQGGIQARLGWGSPDPEVSDSEGRPASIYRNLILPVDPIPP